MTRLPEFDPCRLATLDLTSPALHADHDLTAVWRFLRDEHPLFRHPAPPGGREFWAVTRHEDAMAVFRDGQRFTSTAGNVLETLLAGGDSASGKMLAVSDGARHAELRRILTAALTPQWMARLAEQISAQVRDLVTRSLDDDGCDFGRDVAARVPLTTICDLLAVPEGDREYLHRLGSSSVSSQRPGYDTADSWTSKNEILAYFIELADERRDCPGDDLVSVLARARVRGRPLSTEEVVFNCYSLVLGGDETSRLAMTGAVLALAEHPAQWGALRDGTVGLDSAVEEVLRWTAPSRHLGRTATEDVQLASGRVAAGDVVTVWIASANFDERVFADPAAFRLDRQPNRHLTFAYGPHFCLGARLARIQLEATLAALRDLVGGITLTGTPRRVHSNFIGGTFALPVLLTARPPVMP